MKKIAVTLISTIFLFQSTAFGLSELRPPSHFNKTTETFIKNQNTQESDNNSNLASNQEIKNIKKPDVGHVEPVADAYVAIQKGDYDKAYELVMEGLLGEDYVVNIETAIGILNTLAAYYGTNTQEEKELSDMLTIVTKYGKDVDQSKMKVGLRTILISGKFKNPLNFNPIKQDPDKVDEASIASANTHANVILERYGNVYIEYVPAREYIISYIPDITGQLPEDGKGFSPANYLVSPLTDLSNLERIAVLFGSRYVLSNPSDFEKAVKQLKMNKNIPVIFMEGGETEQSVRFKLKNISLEGIEFREFSWQDSFSDTVYPSGVESQIVGIDNLRCIPLTDTLRAAYGPLQQAWVKLTEPSKAYSEPEPIKAAYDLSGDGSNYALVYELIMKGLQDDGYKDKIAMVIPVLEKLAAYYGPEIERGKEIGNKLEILKNEQAYFKIALWVVSNFREVFYKWTDISSIMDKLREGKVSIEEEVSVGRKAAYEFQGTMAIRINLRKNIVTEHSKGYSWQLSGEPTLSSYIGTPVDRTKVINIPDDITGLVQDILGIKVLKTNPYNYDKDQISSRAKLFLLGRAAKMTEDDIGKCLRSLGKDVKSPKVAITKKLTKLQQKRPETTAIIQEKALELLEIDEANFRDALQPFIGDYIAIRDAIRTAGVADDTAEFYNLFDAAALRMDSGGISFDLALKLAKESRFYDVKPESLDRNQNKTTKLEEIVYNKFNTTQERNEALIALKNLKRGIALLIAVVESVRDINELRLVCNTIIPRIEEEGIANKQSIADAIKFLKLYGDFDVVYTVIPAVTHEKLVYQDWHNMVSGGEEYETVVDSPSYSRTKVVPVTNLSDVKLTPALFLDTEVAANPDAFKQGLAQLKSNEGNIPVVLLTEETKESIMAKLKGIDLTGVQFRTKAELGLQDLEWGKDERVSLIDGIANLKCIPLTSALCETYKDLQKARDQV